MVGTHPRGFFPVIVRQVADSLGTTERKKHRKILGFNHRPDSHSSDTPL
jgi:hypothetical protein